MDNELKKNILKTGTTLVGIKCKDGVVMAADRQTTAGNVVMNKNKQKVMQLNDYLVFSGCGLAAATDRIKRILPAELRIKQLKSKKRPSVKESATLLANIIYSNIRQPSMVPDEMGALIAGYNEDGSTAIYTIDPAGSIHEIEDYDASFGSGMPYVLGYLERHHTKEVTIQEGVKLAIESLKSSTQRDTGSGYGIDVYSITKDGIKQEEKQEIKSNYSNRE